MIEQREGTVLVQREGSGFGRLLISFVGGAAAGAIAGLLLAPYSGAESRAKIRELATKARDKVARLPQVIHEAGVAAKDTFENRVGHDNGK